MTGEQYRETATATAYDLVLALCRRRLSYLGHVLRMPADRMVRCALMALVIDASHYPTGSLFSDCRASRCHNSWQWRRVVHCGAPKWRLCRELNCVFKWFLVMLMYHRTLGFAMNKCIVVMLPVDTTMAVMCHVLFCLLHAVSWLRMPMRLLHVLPQCRHM